MFEIINNDDDTNNNNIGNYIMAEVIKLNATTKKKWALTRMCYMGQDFPEENVT